MKTRLDRLSSLILESHLDFLLVTNLINVRYLTGFSGTNGVAIIGNNIRAFITDFRYAEQARQQVDASFDRITAKQELLRSTIELLPKKQIKLGFDEAHLTVKQFELLRELVGNQVELVSAGGLVEQLRAVKEPAEIKAIAAAAQLVDDIYRWIGETGVTAKTEQQLTVEIEHQLRLRGARPSFDFIVASGAHSALPHAQPRDMQIETDTLLTIDIGAELNGYCSDCTRTFALGHISDFHKEIYELVLKAQLAGLDAVQAQKSRKSIDFAARKVIDEAGYGEQFGHNLGHGVGLEVHEAPRLSRLDNSQLVANNVITIEPGIYLPGKFGVRIEDLVVVTEKGSEVLTHFPKQLTFLD